MSESDKPAADAAAGGSESPSSSGGANRSPTVPPASNLSTTERRVFDHICMVLREANIPHLTSGLTITVISKTWVAWSEALKKCELDGRHQTSKNGWHSSTPWADDESRLKAELNQWLQKAALDPQSLARLLKELGTDVGQDDLFADLVDHATNLPGRSLLN